MKQVALVTGSSRGIGRAVALELAREGYDVCVNYLQHREAAESLVSQLREMGGEAIAVQADVADSRAVEDMVRQTEDALGPVTLLVNNAGISWYGLFQDTDDSTWDRVLAVNLTGARNAARAVLPRMISEKAGCIINISSSRDRMSQPRTESYTAAKGGISALTHGLAASFAGRVRVNSVSPGWIDTEDAGFYGPDADQHPAGRVGTPEDIARVVLFLASDQAGFITGQDICVDGGMTKLMIYHNDCGWRYEP